MPTYSFRNKDTGEQFDKFLKFSERETFLTENPVLEQIITSVPNLGDPVRLGFTKPPSDFQKGIIGRMQQNMSNSTAVSRFGVPREW